MAGHTSFYTGASDGKWQYALQQTLGHNLADSCRVAGA